MGFRNMQEKLEKVIKVFFFHFQVTFHFSLMRFKMCSNLPTTIQFSMLYSVLTLTGYMVLLSVHLIWVILRKCLKENSRNKLQVHLCGKLVNVERILFIEKLSNTSLSSLIRVESGHYFRFWTFFSLV